MEDPFIVGTKIVSCPRDFFLKMVTPSTAHQHGNPKGVVSPAVSWVLYIAECLAQNPFKKFVFARSCQESYAQTSDLTYVEKASQSKSSSNAEVCSALLLRNGNLELY